MKNGIAEIEGFDPEHLRAFSTRRQEILEAAGPDASARARQVANLETRRAKERDLTSESLRERWHSRAQEIGLDRETIGRTFGRGRQAPDGMVRVAAVEATLTAHASHFDRRDRSRQSRRTCRRAPRPPRSRRWPMPFSLAAA